MFIDLTANTTSQVVLPSASSAMQQNSMFGSSVCTLDNFLFVGAAGQGAMGNRVYVYTLSDPSKPSLLQILNDTAVNSKFGISVSAYDKNLIVGAPGNNKTYIYTFQASTGSYVLQSELFISGSPNFGLSVSISLNTAIVGAKGRAYVYGLSPDNLSWILLNTLGPLSASVQSTFGISVSIANGTAIVGDSFKKFAYFFFGNRTKNSWKASTPARIGNTDKSFGISVAITKSNQPNVDGEAVVGTQTGSSYLYYLKNKVWVESASGIFNCPVKYNISTQQYANSVAIMSGSVAWGVPDAGK